MPGTTSTVIKLEKKQGYIIQNKDKNSINKNQLTSGSTTKPQSSKQYGTGTKAEI